MYQDADFAAIDKPEQIPEVKGLKKDVYYRSLVERAAHAGLNVTNASHEAFVNSTVITFARRFARYKRMGLPWHRKELPFVMTLLKWQWISVVWGGKAHPDDKDQLKEWNRRHQQVRDIPNVLPLMNYDLPMIASLAKAGSDIWLNMSLTGHEACGTSGMIGAADCCYDVATHDGMFLEFLKHVIIFGSRHSSDDDILRLSEDDRWHEEYNYDAKDLWQKMHHLISRFRLKDPTLYVELFEAKLQAEEQFSALPVFQKYIAELYSD
jgi:glucan phosphorylase